METHPASLFIVLLHYPVLNRTGDIITTSVANMDIHDISRVARTYGVKRYYLTTPIAEQRDLVLRILNHWQCGYGATFNPHRKEAFRITAVKNNLEEVLREISATDPRVKLVATGACLRGDSISHRALREKIETGEDSFLIVFGTGSGLASEIVRQADYRLEPIMGPGTYNHLSVRAAVAITLDRLCMRSGKR